jgi:hypothetical protein
VEVTAIGATATVGTNDVRGPRLEDGFVGVDASGAMVNSPPYPHARPALQKVAPPFAVAMGKVIEEAVS